MWGLQYHRRRKKGPAAGQPLA
uniref:Uncharacterized protein n=1 Tax=Arundo donax TaxID=35708 RepID=A0A0A8Y085_ARUDO